MVVVSIHGTCEKCGSEGSIHLIVGDNGDYGWVCDRCVDRPEHAMRPISVVN